MSEPHCTILENTGAINQGIQTLFHMIAHCVYMCEILFSEITISTTCASVILSLMATALIVAIHYLLKYVVESNPVENVFTMNQLIFYIFAVMETLILMSIIIAGLLGHSTLYELVGNNSDDLMAVASAIAFIIMIIMISVLYLILSGKIQAPDISHILCIIMLAMLVLAVYSLYLATAGKTYWALLVAYLAVACLLWVMFIVVKIIFEFLAALVAQS